jgi:hypothetical protein
MLTAVLTSFRRIAVFVLTVGLVAGAWKPCAGWAATPEARMSCCERTPMCPMHARAGHGPRVAVGQSDADTCCAAAERRDTPQPSAPAAVLAPVPMPVLAVFVELPSASTLWVDSRRPPPLLASRQLPRHLLLSVFLI